MNTDHFIHPFFKESALLTQGLNLQAVLDIAALPEDVSEKVAEVCGDGEGYRQLVLIGHGGRGFWKAVESSLVDGQASDPMDAFSVKAVEAFLAERAPGLRYRVLYPGSSLLPLQRLGELVGWHHESPFKLGVNSVWGSWFAYRVVLLTDADWTPSQPLAADSPCLSCEQKPCVSACPAEAMSGEDFNLAHCINFRQSSASPCQQRCLARLSCPVGAEHRYEDDQLRYHYLHSLSVIDQMAEIPSSERHL